MVVVGKHQGMRLPCHSKEGVAMERELLKAVSPVASNSEGGIWIVEDKSQTMSDVATSNFDRKWHMTGFDLGQTFWTFEIGNSIVAFARPAPLLYPFSSLWNNRNAGKCISNNYSIYLPV